MDAQKKKQFIIIGALGAVLAGVLVYQLVLAGDPPPGSTPSSGEKTQTASGDKASGDNRPAPRGASPVNLLKATEINIEELTQSVEVQPLDYSAVRIARNPMAPLVGITSAPPPSPGEGESQVVPDVGRREVTGIIWDEVNPVAIIDNMVVPEGYKFADGLVVQVIEPTRVLLFDGVKLRPLEMKEF